MAVIDAEKVNCFSQRARSTSRGFPSTTSSATSSLAPGPTLVGRLGLFFLMSIKINDSNCFWRTSHQKLLWLASLQNWTKKSVWLWTFKDYPQSQICLAFSLKTKKLASLFSVHSFTWGALNEIVFLYRPLPPPLLLCGQNTKFGRINCSLSHLQAYNVCTVPGKRGNDAKGTQLTFTFTFPL